jgi:hypothetical protein
MMNDVVIRVLVRALMKRHRALERLSDEITALEVSLEQAREDRDREVVEIAEFEASLAGVDIEAIAIELMKERS